MITITGKGQTVRFFCTGRVGNSAYRIQIKVDSIREQGRASLEIWSAATSSWNELSSLTGFEMRADSSIGYKPMHPDKHDFWDDVRALLQRGSVISDDPLQFVDALAEAMFD